MMKTLRTTLWLSTGLVGLLALVALPASADQQILDDLIVVGSACVGQDCVNGESFGFDTLRLKENNLRIKAQDTSTSASFPTNDWQITFNDSSNGGQNKFSIDDIDGGRTPFTISAGARSNALFVNSGGRIGIGTANPVADVHIVRGNTPTLRLDQDGSSGFTPQVWDVAGNEANFFVRDATNGSKLPFRIFPGAPDNALTIRNPNGDVGLGTTNPVDELHIRHGRDDDVFVELESTHATAQNTGFRFRNSSGVAWNMFNTSLGNFRVNAGGGVGPVLELNRVTGDLSLLVGNCSDVGGGGGCTPDYVFEPDYELMSLEALAAFVAENKHLPNVPSAADNAAHGVALRRLSFAMLEKIEELVLYTIQQQETIETLSARLEALERPE